jgi:hypothetical protein
MSSAKVKHELHSAAQVLYGFAVVALVMLGIGGTVYKIIAPNGWIAEAFGRSISAGTAMLGSLVLIAGLAWFSRSWRSPRSRNRTAELLVYTSAAAGMLYLAQMWTKVAF